MQKIIIDNTSNKVLHIINLDEDSTFFEEWYPDCYIIDDENNEINEYGLIYNQEEKCFEAIEGYIEEECPVLPSDFEVLNEKLNEKDVELLELKLAMAEMVEEKDAEILELKLALAEIVEGVLI